MTIKGLLETIEIRVTGNATAIEQVKLDSSIATEAIAAAIESLQLSGGDSAANIAALADTIGQLRSDLANRDTSFNAAIEALQSANRDLLSQLALLSDAIASIKLDDANLARSLTAALALRSGGTGDDDTFFGF
jgi:predicted Zn-dependent peptidase